MRGPSPVGPSVSSAVDSYGPRRTGVLDHPGAPLDIRARRLRPLCCGASRTSCPLGSLPACGSPAAATLWPVQFVLGWSCPIPSSLRPAPSTEARLGPRALTAPLRTGALAPKAWPTRAGQGTRPPSRSLGHSEPPSARCLRDCMAMWLRDPMVTSPRWVHFVRYPAEVACGRLQTVEGSGAFQLVPGQPRRGPGQALGFS